MYQLIRSKHGDKRQHTTETGRRTEYLVFLKLEETGR